MNFGIGQSTSAPSPDATGDLIKERERPVYYPSKSSSVLWCFGTESRAYHCTVGVVLGEAGSTPG